MKKRALLVIDVQMGLFLKNNPVYQENRLLENITKLIDLFRAYEQKVIFVQHENVGSLKTGLDNWQLHPQMKPLISEPTLYKSQGSAFSNRLLKAYLEEQQIEEVVIVGLVTHGCIKATIKDAQALLPTVVISDAHSNFHEDGELIINVWNEAWREEGLDVLTTEAITTRFKQEKN